MTRGEIGHLLALLALIAVCIAVRVAFVALGFGAGEYLAFICVVLLALAFAVDRRGRTQ